MVALATAGHPAFVVSDVELEREGPSYTVDTVRAFRASHPLAEDRLVLIVGSDSSARAWPMLIWFFLTAC